MTQAQNVAVESSQINSSGVLQPAGGGTGVTTSTGSGNNVLSTSPTLVTPALGTPSSAVLTNATGLPVGGISATGTPSSTTYLRGDSTWSSITGMVYPGAGIANSTGSAWGTSYTTTGSGTVVALATSPSFTTPNIGAASGTSLSLSSTISASNFSGSSSGTNTGDQTNISGNAATATTATTANALNTGNSYTVNGLTVNNSSAPYMTFTGGPLSRTATFGMTDGYNMYLNPPGGGNLQIGACTVGAITGSSASFSSTISASNFSGSSSGTNTGDQTNISGNAGTVTNGVYTTSSQIAKAWVTYNASTMTILASFGVSSITNISSNIVVKITFSTAFADTNFAYAGSCLVGSQNGFVAEQGTRSTTTLTIATWYQYNATVASSLVSMVAFR